MSVATASSSSPAGDGAPVPVVVFTGFLGAGKTTVIQRTLPQVSPREAGVLTIVNDLSADNTDVAAFKRAEGSAGPGPVAALSGGCVCCNLLGDLVHELLQAHGSGCSYVFLECTGVADPVPVVATLGALPALKGKFAVDAVVTVLNAAVLAAATVAGVGPAVSLDGDAIGELALRQLLGANVVLINNWEQLCAAGEASGRLGQDSVPRAALSQWPDLLRGLLGSANPAVRVVFTARGAVDFGGAVWRRSLFDADGTLPYYLRQYAEEGKELGDFGVGPDEEARELARLGLRVFTFQSEVLVASTARLRGALAGRQAPGKRLLRGVWRSKGFFDAIDDEGGAADAQRRQFRWQTVRRRFDYGEVLPPTVPLVGEGAAALTCRIVFMGDFDLAQKQSEAAAFFEAIAAPSPSPA